ncbi:MAG: hypothetical protein V1810_00165 [Candidatus Beckwithbacteria bacterium]
MGNETLKKFEGVSEPSRETYLERAVDDLDVKLFVKNFLQPHTPEDSLEFMAVELVTLKTDENLKASQQIVQELIHNPHSRQIIGNFVDINYDLKSHLEEREKQLEENYGLLGILLHRERIQKFTKTEYHILKSFCSLVEKTQEIDSDSAILSELKKLGQTISQDENYQAVQNMVEAMDNYGDSNIQVRYNYFNSPFAVAHIKMKPNERWKEMLSWYSHFAKTTFEEIISVGVAHIFTTRREDLFVKTFELMIEKNSDSIIAMLGYRKIMDFFLGAPRFIETMKSYDLPLAFPKFTNDTGLDIEGLYNPSLILQTHINNKEDLVANEVKLGSDKNVAVITGPNNTGKSIYVKGIGLACALGFNGFPMPAEKAVVGKIDRLFTHFVHPEDIKLGEGSFLDELARIKEALENSTSRSVIIIDEPIRGSSPEDSEEITLWLIKGLIELKAPTFLTTHLHSVANKVSGFNGVKNLQTEIELIGRTIKPTYKVIEGKSGKSYGVELARQVGLSEKDILNIVKDKPPNF